MRTGVRRVTGSVEGSSSRWIVLCMLVLLWLGVACQASPSEYRRFESPDGRFAVVVLSRPTRGLLPGQAGDASGVVQLQTREGKILAEEEVELVQVVHEVRWEPDRVDVKLVAEWPLPPP